METRLAKKTGVLQFFLEINKLREWSHLMSGKMWSSKDNTSKENWNSKSLLKALLRKKSDQVALVFLPSTPEQVLEPSSKREDSQLSTKDN